MSRWLAGAAPQIILCPSTSGWQGLSGCVLGGAHGEWNPLHCALTAFFPALLGSLCLSLSLSVSLTLCLSVSAGGREMGAAGCGCRGEGARAAVCHVVGADDTPTHAGSNVAQPPRRGARLTRTCSPATHCLIQT